MRRVADPSGAVAGPIMQLADRIGFCCLGLGSGRSTESIGGRCVGECMYLQYDGSDLVPHNSAHGLIWALVCNSLTMEQIWVVAMRSALLYLRVHGNDVVVRSVIYCWPRQSCV
jgi:hypothetical protein